MTEIHKVSDITKIDLSTILSESISQGYRFIPKLIAQWQSGENTFSKPNETFISYQRDGKLIGIGGINEEPYLRDINYGRLRHVYVLNDFRRKHIGKTIIENLIEFAKANYQYITLRTPDERASKFYLSLGFAPTQNIETVTHIMKLRV